jgi:toxin ParE1/3/4
MSPKRVKKTPRAYTDLEEAADYLETRADARLALRFLDAAEETFRKLSLMPSLGPVHSTAQGIRTWQVKGFERYIIAYRPLNDGVEIIRVLHGARNWQALLEEQGP